MGEAGTANEGRDNDRLGMLHSSSLLLDPRCAAKKEGILEGSSGSVEDVASLRDMGRKLALP